MNVPNPLHLDRAARVLRAGGVIACATEGVWGLGCDPFDAAAVARVLALKGRSAAQGLILVAADIAQVEPLLCRVPAAVRAALEASWPGPVTWIVPVRDELPAWIVGRHASAALRVTAHPQLRALCRAFGGPLVSTSANPHGLPAARTELGVRRYFRDRIDYILPGETGGRRGPSRICDALTGRILRA